MADTSPSRKIGILGGMPEEVAGLIAQLDKPVTTERGRCTYYSGRLHEADVVVVFSRWGKVATATTVTHLLLEFGITELVFTGLCGAVSPSVRVGDLVLGSSFYQHDMDATPLMPRFEIPLLGIAAIDTDPQRLEEARRCLQAWVDGYQIPAGVDPAMLTRLGVQRPRLHVGAIASGDQFIADAHERNALREVLPDILCVEMEGAAVAQVCYEYGLPFTIVRIVSDGSDEQSENDFLAFTRHVASAYSVEVVGCLLAASVPSSQP